MAISNPMGKVPSGISTSETVDKVDIKPGGSADTSAPEPTAVGYPEDDAEMRQMRKQVEKLRLGNEIAKQKAIKAGKIPLTKIY